MPGVLAGAMTPALVPLTAMGACTPHGVAAVLLPGTGAPVMTRPSAVADASKPRPEWAQARLGRLDAPQQHDLPKFAYNNRIAAASGAAAGPHPAWDPV